MREEKSETIERKYDRKGILRKEKITRRSTKEITIPSRIEQRNLKKEQGKWLKRKKWPATSENGKVINGVDLFSGCGGITMGLWDACRENGLKLEMIMACDLFPAAQKSFEDNFKPKIFLNEPIENYVNGEIGSKLTKEEKSLKKMLGDINVVVGGPPCQGNSNLNNHTRYTDPRNELYMRMIRFVEVIKPEIILIENVRGVVRAKQNVVGRASDYLTDKLGYSVDNGVIKGVDIGIPQTRIRHFTIAVRKKGIDFSFDHINSKMVSEPRPVSWAIGDLFGNTNEKLFDSTPSVTKINQDRMNYLIDNDVYNLPNKERPPCQQKDDHTYPAVYGRMWWDKPAPTLTTGFGCNGRGRFTHPKEPRVLTPHEAARVQTFPDFFDFSMIEKRTDLHDLIGNAVPPLMAKHVIDYLLKMNSMTE